MPRKYQLKQRAEKMEETRQRIVEATVALHEELGPAQTTISAIAARAGVERLTVYRHFPDEEALFSACTTEYWSQYPIPDPQPWVDVADPMERLGVALRELYAYYRQTEAMTLKSMRDVAVKPALAKAVEAKRDHWMRIQEVLMDGWTADAEQMRLIAAAVGHATGFQAWHELCRQQGLTEEEAIEVMLAMAGGVAGRTPAVLPAR